MRSSYSLRPADAEPVVRAHLLDVLALTGSTVAEVEDGDRLDALGLADLPAAWLITELHVATGVDPFAREGVFTDVRTVGDLITVYRDALHNAASSPPPTPPAVPSPDPLIGPVRDLGSGRFAAPLLPHASGDPERRLQEAVLLEAVTQLWTAAVPRDLPGRSRRMRIWTDRVNADFTAPVFPVGAILECAKHPRAPEPLCARIDVTAEAHQAGVRAAVFDAELRVVPAAVARTYEALKARQAARVT